MGFENDLMEAPAEAAPVAPAAASRPLPWRAACAECRVRSLCVLGRPDEGALPDTLLIARRRLRMGETLHAAGGASASVYVVRSGTLKSTEHGGNGREQVTGFHLPGDALGLEIVAGGMPRSFVTALEDSEVCAVPHLDLARAAAGNVRLHQRLWSVLSAEIVRTQQMATLLALGRAEERVAAFLVGISRRMQERGYSAREFHLRMSRADIGSYLGLTLETVSRTLSGFAHKRMLKVHKKHVCIEQPEELVHESGFAELR
jgi:CRP/FNR family transcriptional regulator